MRKNHAGEEPSERTCLLSWDSIYVTKGVFYHKHSGQILGFEDVNYDVTLAEAKAIEAVAKAKLDRVEQQSMEEGTLLLLLPQPLYRKSRVGGRD